MSTLYIKNVILCAIITFFLQFFCTAIEIQLYPFTYDSEPMDLERNKTTVTIIGDSCTNLPQQIARKAQSTKLYNCAQFYDQQDCTGISLQLSRLSPQRGNLRMWNFHSKTMSVGACQDSCIPEIGQGPSSNKTVSITLYTLEFYQGRKQHIYVRGCTRFNESGYFRETFKSIFVPPGKCVLAFLDKEEGDVSEDCILNNDEEKMNRVLEFRDGMPQLYSINVWPPYHRIAKVTAFSPCNCTAFTSSETLGLLNLSPDDKYAVLFSETGFEGSHLKIMLNSIPYSKSICINVDHKFVEKSMSIGTTQECIKLYDELNCEGNFIRLSLRTPFRDNLQKWGYNGRVYSVKVCEDSCVPNSEKAASFFDPDHSAAINITYYFDPNWLYKEYTLQVRGCTHTGIKQFTRDIIYSAKVPKDTCVLAFLRNYSLDGDFNRSQSKPYCSVEDRENVLELCDGNPGLWNILGWYKWWEYIIAFSPCNCDYVSNVAGSGEEVVKLYSNVNFGGRSVTIPLNFTGCKNFANDKELEVWEGVARSIYVSNGSCVQAYKEHECGDESQLRLTTSVTDLFVHNLDYSIRSLSICKVGNGEPPGKSILVRVAYYLILIGCVILLIGVILGVILVFLRRRALRIKNEMGKILSDNEIDEFLEGLRIDTDARPERSVDDSEHKSGEGTDDLEQPPSELSTELLAQSQPYNYELEISRSQLEFDAKCPIGEGQYGLVLKGTLRQEHDIVSVAIKTTKPFSGAESLRVLLKEVKVLMFVGQHTKIVTLMGCCTTNLRQGELLVVMEFCENGSLEKYLQANRSNFENSVQVQKKKQDEPQQSVQYTEILFHSKPDKNEEIQYVDIIMPTGDSPIAPTYRKSTLNTNQLIAWSVEIAEGMEYLASKKVIHGDLSARNILLLADKTAKISDFGLARKLYAYEQYIKNGDDALPWRWLALEALKKMEFSTASDVWSYGILLWEIFTLGEQPYPGVPLWTNNFIANLEQGLRPAFPSFATLECYKIMQSCWKENPLERPSFSRLVFSLEKTKKY